MTLSVTDYQHMVNFWKHTRSSRYVFPNGATMPEVMRVHHRVLQNFEACRPICTPITELRLQRRTRNCLANEGIKTVAEILGKSQHELLRLPHFGRGSLEDLAKTLEQLVPPIETRKVETASSDAFGIFKEQAVRNARLRALRDRVLQLVIQYPDEAYARGIAARIDPKVYGYKVASSIVGLALRRLVELGELEGPILITAGPQRNRKYYKVTI